MCPARQRQIAPALTVGRELDSPALLIVLSGAPGCESGTFCRVLFRLFVAVLTGVSSTGHASEATWLSFRLSISPDVQTIFLSRRLSPHWKSVDVVLN